jgi:hypothetical protein
MYGKIKMGTMRKIVSGLLLALVLGLIFPNAQPQAAYAQDALHAENEEYGYLWSLEFTFDNDYNGLLTIEVGPWKNGELAEVDATSTARVRCEPVGAVALVGGSAVFSGGHLKCAMDLAAIVRENHKLKIDEIDDYGSILMRAIVNPTASTVAPIFTHKDAEYSIDFTQTSQVTMNQELWNNAGLLQQTFPVPVLNSWHDYTDHYICISNGGPCDAYFDLDGQLESFATAGSRAQFTTTPQSFQIGGPAFQGQLSYLLVDPGNSAH